MIREISVSELSLIRAALRAVQGLHHQNRADRFRDPETCVEEMIGSISRLMVAEGLRVLVWEHDGTCVGFLGFEIVESPQHAFWKAVRFGHLHHISVLPAYQRQGIGLALIAAMKEHLRAADVSRWEVSYWSFNTASAALMARAGAVPMWCKVEANI